MDNGILVFIVILEAAIIVWLLSKLKQYRKFEHMLSATSAEGADAEASLKASAAAAVSSVNPAKGIASTTAALGAEDLDDDLLDMPGVESEVNIEQAKRVQLVMARCQYAGFYLEQLDDDYERGQFKHIVGSCKNTARAIEDPFFKASALHPIILLLDRAGWLDKRDKLMAEVQDDIIRERIETELEGQQA